MQANPQQTGLLPLAVIGAAIGMIVALACVGVMWMMNLGINAAVVGGISGAAAGALTVYFAAADQIH